MWRTCRFACTCTIAYMYMHKCMYMLWIRGERFLESSTGREGGISSDSHAVDQTLDEMFFGVCAQI